MNVKGFIKKIAPHREWTSRDGQLMFSLPITITVPYINAKGEERADDMIGEFVIGNLDYLAKLREAIEKKQRMEFQLGFSVNEYQGREYQRIKIYNLSIVL